MSSSYLHSRTMRAHSVPSLRHHSLLPCNLRVRRSKRALTASRYVDTTRLLCRPLCLNFCHTDPNPHFSSRRIPCVSVAGCIQPREYVFQEPTPVRPFAHAALGIRERRAPEACHWSRRRRAGVEAGSNNASHRERGISPHTGRSGRGVACRYVYLTTRQSLLTTPRPT